MIHVKNLTKFYYSTGEVAEMFGVKPSLLRYYEAEFSFFQPEKRHGERRFTVKDIEDFALLLHLIKERGFTLEGAAKEFKTQQVKSRQKARVLNKLTRLRDKLVRMRDELK